MKQWLRRNKTIPVSAWILFAALCVTGSAIAQPQPIGHWEFNDSGYTTKATVGEELELLGDTDDIPIDGISGSDKAVTVPLGTYYRIYPGISANGGGSYVNQFSFLFDFRVPELGSWYAFYQTNSDNANDGDAFVNTSGNIGVGDTGYSVFAIQPQQWYRLIVAVDLEAGTIDYYLDGTLIQSSTGQSVDGRFSIYTIDHDTPWCYVIADENGDDADMDVSTIMMFDSALTADDAAALKGPLGAEVAPMDPTVPNTPTISVSDTSAFENVIFTCSDFAAGGDLTHVRTSWQIAIDEAFETIVMSEDRTTDMTTLLVDNSRLAFGLTYYARVLHSASNGKNSEFSAPVIFSLTAPSGLKTILSEDFESVAPGDLPSGWHAVNFSDAGGNEGFESWAVWPLETLNEMEYYPDYADAEPSIYDSATPIVTGNSLHADSGGYGDPYFEAHVISPEYDLSGVSDVYIVFNSDYLQNQDNIAALEFTIVGGNMDEGGAVSGTWLPVVYYLDTADITYDDQGNVDAEATFDPNNIADGTMYGYVDYIFAPQSMALTELAPYIVARFDDSTANSKRFERFRLPQADNQSSVRFRWTYMGTWSWYWGIDDLQIWGDDGTDISDWALY